MVILFEKWINILKKIGLIYTKTDPFKQKFIGFLFRLIFIESVLFLQLAYLKDVKDLVDFTRCLSTLSTYVSYYAKALNMIFNAKALLDLAELLKLELNNYEFNEKFQNRISRVKNLLHGLMAAAFVVTFIGGLTPWFLHELYVKMWFPYEPNTPTLFAVSVLYQHISTSGGSWADVALELIPVLFMAYFTAMLEQLCDELENLKKPKTPIEKLFKRRQAWTEGSSAPPSKATYHEKLTVIIEKHKKLIDILKKFEQIFNITFFIRGLTSTIVFCTTAFTLVVLEDTSLMISFFVYMLATSCQLSIPSYYGNEISFLSDRLSTSLFHSEWYEESEKKKILMLITFMKRKIKITSFKIFHVDLETFMTVCNSAYSLYAVFKNFQH